MKRDYALDGLRGVAILFVIAVHASRSFPPEHVPAWFRHYIVFGWCSIELFFVLSGFLITNILLAKPGLWNFYVGRFFRIFPLYYLFLVLSFGVFPRVFPAAYGVMPWKNALWYFGYASNILAWIHREFLSFQLDVSWSLALEEQFYLLWPAVLLLSPRRFLPVGCLAAAAASFLFNVGAIALGAPRIGIYSSLPGQLTPLMLGAYLALAPGRSTLGPKAGLAVFGAASAAILLFVPDLTVAGQWAHITMFVTSCFFACLLALVRNAACPPRLRSALSFRPFVLAGTYSYAAYLFHVPIITLLILEGPATGFWLFFLLVYTLTFGLGALSWRFVETPLLDFRKRLRARGPKLAIQP